MCATCGNRVMAFARVVSSVSGSRSDILIWWDLVEQFGQHGRVADIAAGDLDSPDLQRLLINSDVYLSPDALLGAAVLARVPLAFAFALGLDAGAVHCPARHFEEMSREGISRSSGPVPPR